MNELPISHFDTNHEYSYWKNFKSPIDDINETLINDGHCLNLEIL